MVTKSTCWPEWVGMVVKVISKGAPDRPPLENYWEVDIPTETCRCFVQEQDLMRIDDPDIQDQLEEESRKSKLDKYKEKVYAKVFFDRPIKTFIHRSDTPGI